MEEVDNENNMNPKIIDIIKEYKYEISLSFIILIFFIFIGIIYSIYFKEKIFFYFNTSHRSLSYAQNHVIYGPAVNTWKKIPNWKFYSDDDCLTIFENPEIKQYLDTYQSIDIPVSRADMWRYLKLFLDGGWWIDADIYLDTPNNLPYPKDINKMYIQPENETSVCNMMFYSPPKHPVLKKALELIKYRIKNTDKKKEHYIHYCTGPSLFTDSFRQVSEINLPQNVEKWPHNHKLFNMYHTNLGLIEIKSIFDSCHHGYAGQSSDGWLTLARRDKNLNY
jgi:hypothetical protein